MKLSYKKIIYSSQKAVVAFLVFTSRWLVLAPNFSPLGSYGFYGQNLGLFLLNIVVFDRLKSGFYPGFIFTYLGFFGYFIVGKVAANKKNKKQNASFWLNLKWMSVASFWFFAISNFGVWLYWYPHTWQGLLSCYAAALPFYRNTFMSDIFFSSLVMLGQSIVSIFNKNKFYQSQSATTI